MPLHLAVWLKLSVSKIATRRRIVQLLIDHRADIHLRLQSGPFLDAQGKTPIHCARYYGLAKVLIENKADVNAEYSFPGTTPLYSIIRGVVCRLKKNEDPKDYIGIARLLCLSGADVNKQLSNGKTLLQMTADAALQMEGPTAKQKLKELFTILQTTKPDQKKMETGTSPIETKKILSGWDWINPFNWRTGTEIQTPAAPAEYSGSRFLF